MPDLRSEAINGLLPVPTGEHAHTTAGNHDALRIRLSKIFFTLFTPRFER